MANNNDEKILTLKKQIEEKKSKIKKSKKFEPVTNCSIEFDGERFNIQVLGKMQIIQLMVKLQSYLMAANELEVIDHLSFSGYHAKEWIEDLKAKFEHINRKDEEQKLRAMESKLDKLLSSDKKIELEIDEIESLLKD